jgi:DUF1009 family protein
MSQVRTLGIIAGGGELPVRIAAHRTARREGVFVARIEGFADAKLDAFPGAAFGLGQMGLRIDALRAAECDAIVFAGLVTRPSMATLELDAVAMEMLPAVLGGARNGDDGLLRALVAEHEKRGFVVIGAEEALGALQAPLGAMGNVAPNADHLADIEKAATVASALGALDIGQGCVVCDGLVLAVEAQEGTDRMIARVIDLPEPIRGTADARRGVLVKRPKPQQERRIDLPTIGVRTIEGAAAAGLAGVAVEAGGALIIDHDDMVARADALGLFVYGFAL